MKKLLLSFFMCMLAILCMQAAEEVTDVLTAKDFVATTTTYKDFSGVKKNVAEYAGNSANNSGNIQLRSTNSNSGIVSTTSGGNVKSVTITVSSGTKQIDVYGSNTAYTSAANLYATDNNTNQGDLLGSLTKTGTITVTGDYKYVGIRSKSGAIYLSQVEITWEVTGEVIPQQLAAPTFSVLEGDVIRGTEVTITAPVGSTLVYTVDGVLSSEEGVNTATVTIDKKTTIEAYATQGGFEDSEVVTATYTIEEPAIPEAGVWTLVKDATTLAVGDRVVIASTGYDVALSTTQNNNNRGQAAVVKNGETITFGNGVQVLTIEEGTKAGTLAFNTGSGYLYAASSSSNHLKTQTTKDDNGSWLITIEEGVATVVAQGTNTKNIMKYNSSSGLFSCYGSGQQPISLYRFESVPFEENIEYGMYYLSPGAWDEPATWYAAQFVNANTSAINWVYGLRKENEGNVGVYYGLEDTENAYTHIMFCAMYGDAPEFDEEKGELKNVADAKAKMIWENVVACSEYLTYKPAATPAYYRIYFADSAEWLDVDPQEATGVNRVEMAGGIGYAYGVVSAEGAIEVYNVNGAVVARGNDTIDLRGLGRGVYIIRNGNQVRKVVR